MKTKTTGLLLTALSAIFFLTACEEAGSGGGGTSVPEGVVFTGAQHEDWYYGSDYSATTLCHPYDHTYDESTFEDGDLIDGDYTNSDSVSGSYPDSCSLNASLDAGFTGLEVDSDTYASASASSIHNEYHAGSSINYEILLKADSSESATSQITIGVAAELDGHVSISQSDVSESFASMGFYMEFWDVIYKSSNPDNPGADLALKRNGAYPLTSVRGSADVGVEYQYPDTTVGTSESTGAFTNVVSSSSSTSAGFSGRTETLSVTVAPGDFVSLRIEISCDTYVKFMDNNEAHSDTDAEISLQPIFDALTVVDPDNPDAPVTLYVYSAEP